MNTAVPNVAIALCIALTIPVTAASGKRSFSKLKLIKHYLRTSMTQECLNSLAMIRYISIKQNIIESLDYSRLPVISPHLGEWEVCWGEEGGEGSCGKRCSEVCWGAGGGNERCVGKGVGYCIG